MSVHHGSRSQVGRPIVVEGHAERLHQCVLCFSVRMGHDGLDTCLTAAMVRVLCFLTGPLLANRTDLRYHSKHYADYFSRCIWIWQSESRHSLCPESIVVACEPGIHSPGGLEAYDTALQIIISAMVLAIPITTLMKLKKYRPEVKPLISLLFSNQYTLA